MDVGSPQHMLSNANVHLNGTVKKFFHEFQEFESTIECNLFKSLDDSVAMIGWTHSSLARAGLAQRRLARGWMKPFSCMERSECCWGC